MVEVKTFIRGGVYLAKLNPSKYDEVGKVRPVVILNTQNILNCNPPLIFICPLSSKSHKEFQYLHIKISPKDKINKTSYALIEHCKSISYQRLHNDLLSVLTNNELEQIIQNLTFMIGSSNI